MRPGVTGLAGQPMGQTLAKNRSETVVVRIFVVLDRADPAEELVWAAVIDVSNRTTGLGRVVVEVAVKMDGMRPEVLQLHTSSFPQFLSPGKVPLIEFLGRQMRAHGDRTHVGPGNARHGRTCARARSGVAEGQKIS